MTEKIRVTWSHNDDETMRYVYIDKAAMDACRDDAEVMELINRAVWEMVSNTGWTIHRTKLVSVEVKDR